MKIFGIGSEKKDVYNALRYFYPESPFVSNKDSITIEGIKITFSRRKRVVAIEKVV